MKKRDFCFAILLIVSIFFAAPAAAQPFYEDIQLFKKQDSLHQPAAHQILLIGSSSFTMWKDVQQYFPGYHLLNRGFGGSSLTDVTRYAGDIIFKYRPRQIIIYCGENDFAASDTINVTTVVSRFQQLYYLIRKKYPVVPIAYVSMKPSPSRQHLLLKFDLANNRIRQFLSAKRNTAFIDVYHAMFKDDGTIMSDIFLEDNLHMNAKGYAIWKKLMLPVLKK